MARPRVLVDFTTSPLETPASFEVLKSRSLEITRGRNHERDRTQPSRVTADLSNLDRNLDPDNADGSHYPNVRPMRHVRAETAIGATTYPLAAAFVEDWGQRWPGKKDAVVPLRATDAFKLINLARVAGTRYFNQLYSDTVDDAIAFSFSAHYYLDEPAGAAFAEDRKNNFDLTTVGTNVTFGDAARPPTYGRPRSVRFGPNNDAGNGLSRGTVPAFDSGSINTFAWACWLRLDALPTDGYIVGLQLGTGGAVHLLWRTNAAGDGIVSYENTAGGTWNAVTSVAGVVVADGEWHHYAVRISIDSSAESLQTIFYRDAVNVGVDTDVVASLSSPGQIIAPSNFFVGGDGGLGGNHGIDGNMAQLVIISNNVPSSAQLEEMGTPAWDHIPVEPAGLQIHSILDGIGWPLDARDIDDGTVDMEAIAFNPGDAVLSVLLDIAETSERGLFFVSDTGIITFRDAASLAARVSLATFGDAGAEIRYQELETRHDDEDIYNQVAITYGGGTVYVEDVLSIQENGPRLLALTVRLAVEADVEALADMLLVAYKDPHTRPVKLTLITKDDTEILEQIFLRRPGDLITVVARPPGGGDPLVLESAIEGTITRGDPGDIWEGNLNLAPAL